MLFVCLRLQTQRESLPRASLHAYLFGPLAPVTCLFISSLLIVSFVFLFFLPPTLHLIHTLPFISLITSLSLAMDLFGTEEMAAALPEASGTTGVVNRLNQEAATLARDKGWTEPEKYDYSRYAAPTEEAATGNPSYDATPWASDARKYEWKEDYGDVGPEDEELEKMLYRHDLINRAGVKFEK